VTYWPAVGSEHGWHVPPVNVPSLQVAGVHKLCPAPMIRQLD